MGKDAPTPPAAPDPYATASAQGTANAGTATAQTALNNANVYTPYGSSTYQVTGQQTITNPDGTTTSVPTYTNTQTLSPGQQTLLRQNTGLSQQLNSIAKGALGNIGATLQNPVTQGQLSPLQLSAGATPSLQSNYSQGAPIQTSYDQGGAIQSSYDQGPALQTGYSTGPALQYGYDQGGAINQNAPTTFGQTSSAIQTSLGNTDFNAARDQTTQSILQRLAPQINSQNAALASQLANQGVTQNSAAWNAAMQQNASQNNDLYLGAINTGNQEQQALFGEALNAGQFANAAQAQDYGQQLGRGQFAQTGTAQNNAAQLQQNQENAAQAGFYNSTAAQDNQRNAALAAFQNASAGQQYQQNAALAAFGNTAQLQQNQENAAAAGFSNTAAGQQNAQNQAQASFGNNTALQDYQARLAGATFDNTAAGQQYQQATGLQNQLINQISALRSGNQVTNPAFQPYSSAQIDQTPLSSDVYATAGLNQSAYNTQANLDAANNTALASIFGGLGKSGGFKSDRRFKRDIKRVATARNGLPIYLYRYRDADGWWLGFMADEVAARHPEAVANDDDGMAWVDYDKAVA